MKFNHAALALASLAGSAVSQTIVDLAVEDGRFTTLVQAVTDADLADALSGEGPLTVFAPVDDAFSAVPSKFLDPMYAAHLKNILLYHVIGDAKVMSTDLSEGLVATTLNGENVTVTSMNPVQINDVDVIIPDLEATNGVIHVVDEVLLPSAATKTIVDLAVATPELSTLVELVTSAGLVDVLSGDGPFTVFAPTNEAFAKLPAEVVKELMDPANVGQLTKILKFHVMSDTIVLSDEISSGAVTQMESTGPSPIVAVDESTIAIADVLASNGVVHVVNEVLIPPETEDTKGESQKKGGYGDKMVGSTEEDSSSAIAAISALIPASLLAAAALFM